MTSEDMIVSSHVVALSWNANRNVMGRAHMNSILDIKMYQIVFAVGEVTVLTASIIADSMYTQCDADGNGYLLLDALVDYHKDNKAVFLTEQHSSIRGRPVTHKTTESWKICCQWKNGSNS